MKFSAPRAALLKAVTFAQSAIQGRTTLPALNTIAVVAEFDSLTLTGTNLDVYTSARCQAEISEPGACCIPAEKLRSFVQSANGETVELELDKNRVALKSGTFKAKLSIMAIEEFPAPKAVKGTELTIPGEQFGEKLNQVKRCQSTDEGRPILNSVFAEFDKGKLTLVATDGRRMACVSFNCAGAGQFILPSPLVDRLEAALDQSAVKCVFSENKASFEGESWTVKGRLMEGQYPNWKQPIPREVKSKVSVPIAEFVSAVRSVKPFTTDKASSITLEFSKKQLRISTQNPENQAEQIIEGIEGMEAQLAVDPDYILDAVAVLKGDRVNIGLIDNLSPIKIEEETYVSVVMPMRAA